MDLYVRGEEQKPVAVPDNLIFERLKRRSIRTINPPYIEPHENPEVVPFHILGTYRLLGEDKDKKIMTLDHRVIPNTNTKDLPPNMVGDDGIFILKPENIAVVLQNTKDGFEIWTYNKDISVNRNYLEFYITDYVTFVWGKPAVGDVHEGVGPININISAGEKFPIRTREQHIDMYQKTLNDVAPDYSGPLAQICEKDVTLEINRELVNPGTFLPIVVQRQKAIDGIIDNLLPQAKEHLVKQ